MDNFIVRNREDRGTGNYGKRKISNMEKTKKTNIIKRQIREKLFKVRKKAKRRKRRKAPYETDKKRYSIYGS